MTGEFEVVVTAKEPLADGVVGLTLRGAGPLPRWEPGAHVDLLLAPGLVRQYSLCGDPADPGTWRVAVLREPGGRGGSAHVHDLLEPGARLPARGPRNNFPLVPADRYLFVAGGIGITPLLPMLAAADAPWRLVYGGRRRSSMAFLDELSRYGDAVSIRPQDETGPLDLDALLAETDPATAVYCCGPAPLLDAVTRRFTDRPPHVERFAPVEAGETGDAPIEVELAASGLTLTVPPGASILEAAEKAGAAVLSSCREGTCGTCETGVLDGVPDHRDSILTGAERETREYMMICVSRARSARLVLDL